MLREPNFLITFPALTLDLEGVWPDKDAPDNPTAADVVKVMDQYGGVSAVIREWCLLPDGIDVTDHNGVTVRFR